MNKELDLFIEDLEKIVSFDTVHGYNHLTMTISQIDWANLLLKYGYKISRLWYKSLSEVAQAKVNLTKDCFKED